MSKSPSGPKTCPRLLPKWNLSGPKSCPPLLTKCNQRTRIRPGKSKYGGRTRKTWLENYVMSQAGMFIVFTMCQACRCIESLQMRYWLYHIRISILNVLQIFSGDMSAVKTWVRHAGLCTHHSKAPPCPACLPVLHAQYENCSFQLDMNTASHPIYIASHFSRSLSSVYYFRLPC